MSYRRRPGARPLQLLFAAALLALGLALPLASAVFSPADPSMAAAALPTARVLRATDDRRRVINDQRPTTSDQRPTAGDQIPTPVLRAAPGNDNPPPAAAVPAPAAPEQAIAAPPPQAEPTRTSTPVPLGMVEANPAAPAATLFPTVAATLFPTVAAQPAESAPGVPLAAPVPILMYHYIRSVDEASDPLGYNLSVTPEDFERQMAWLRDQGYAGVRMDTLARCMRGEALCPAKPIALTFDDGYEDAFTTALPALQRYGMRATFYIISGSVGQPGYMTWEQLAAMCDAGMEIGAHTVTHADLTTLDAAMASYEIAQSKADLEQHLGIGVASFCYPTGLYNWSIEEQVRAAGYVSATTTRWDGDYSDMLALPRRRVAGGTSIDGFVGIVQG
ncbi:MAG TPA: polysaccharide deacetylase family protein [Roseiflexaceae bacterium]